MNRGLWIGVRNGLLITLSFYLAVALVVVGVRHFLSRDRFSLPASDHASDVPAYPLALSEVR